MLTVMCGWRAKLRRQFELARLQVGSGDRAAWILGFRKTAAMRSFFWCVGMSPEIALSDGFGMSVRGQADIHSSMPSEPRML